MAVCAALLGLLIHNSPRLKTWKKFVLVGLGVGLTALAWALYALGHVLIPVSLLLIAMTNGAFIEQASQGLLNFFRNLGWTGQSTSDLK